MRWAVSGQIQIQLQLLRQPQIQLQLLLLLQIQIQYLPQRIRCNPAMNRTKGKRHKRRPRPLTID